MKHRCFWLTNFQAVAPRGKGKRTWAPRHVHVEDMCQDSVCVTCSTRHWWDGLWLAGSWSVTATTTIKRDTVRLGLFLSSSHSDLDDDDYELPEVPRAWTERHCEAVVRHPLLPMVARMRRPSAMDMIAGLQKVLSGIFSAEDNIWPGFVLAVKGFVADDTSRLSYKVQVFQHLRDTVPAMGESLDNTHQFGLRIPIPMHRPEGCMVIPLWLNLAKGGGHWLTVCCGLLALTMRAAGASDGQIDVVGALIQKVRPVDAAYRRASTAKVNGFDGDRVGMVELSEQLEQAFSPESNDGRTADIDFVQVHVVPDASIALKNLRKRGIVLTEVLEKWRKIMREKASDLVRPVHEIEDSQ